jgi:hypothetical protein
MLQLQIQIGARQPEIVGNGVCKEDVDAPKIKEERRKQK